MRIAERKCDCSFLMMPITNYSETSTLYQPTWNDSGVFTIVYRINVDESVTMVDLDLSLHMVDGKPQRDVYDLPKLKDGWYKVRSYILPTRSFLESLGMEDGYNDMEYLLHWILYEPENTFNKQHNMTLAIDEEGICFQGRMANPSPYKSGAFYYWLRADLIDVIDEFQTRGISNGFVYGTNVRVIEEDFFTTCNLYTCFINRALTLLDLYKGCSNNGSSICNNSKYSVKCKSDIDQSEIQIRDYLWMVLKAINYALECEDYLTANKLLGCISTCNGICPNLEAEDCGCSKTSSNVQYKPLNNYSNTVTVSEEFFEKINFENYYNKQEILSLLNSKLDKLTAGIDINITEDNIINNLHRFINDNDIINLWNEQ